MPTAQTAEFFGAKSTVAAIRQAYQAAQGNFKLRQLVEHVCAGIRAKDYLSECLAIYNFVESNTRYMRDPRTVELVKSINLLIDQLLSGQKPQIDCDELAALIAAMLGSTGASVRLVTIAFKHVVHNGEQQFSHIFVQALEPRTNTWVTLDPVAGRQTNKMLNQALIAKVWPIA